MRTFFYLIKCKYFFYLRIANIFAWSKCILSSTKTPKIAKVFACGARKKEVLGEQNLRAYACRSLNRLPRSVRAKMHTCVGV